MEDKVSNKEVSKSNLSQLKALSDKLSQKAGDNHKAILKQLKGIVSDGKDEVESSGTPKSKILCYETMCKTITSLLEDVKI